MTQNDAGHKKLPEDASLQNAILEELARLAQLGVTTSPGSSPAWALYQSLGVKSRTPTYSREEFQAFLDSMVERGLINSEKFYRTSRTLYV
jgi:hypothetical protein